MNKYKIGIIGATGFATEKMLPQLKNSTACEIVSLYARNAKKLKKVADKFKIEKYYTDIKEMLAYTDYDLIYIATPPFLHLNDLEHCLESGRVKNILCEKPIVLNSKELNFLRKLTKKYTNINIFVGHHIRHQRSISDLKSLLVKKVIGDVVFVEGGWSYELDPKAQYAEWKLDPQRGGSSVMGDPGIHIIDLIYSLFGLPEEIKVSGSSVKYKTTYDNVTSLLNYRDKQILINSSQTTPFPKNDLTIVGTKGRIDIANCFSQTYIPEIKITTSKGVETKKYKEAFLYKNEVEDILKIKTSGIGATSLEEALEETKLLIDINKKLS
jgi:predicted dehydrogenase